jgi:hypothetical protein
MISVLFFIYTGYLPAQISPGDLTKAHQDYEGLSNCTKCHVLGEQVYSSKCLDCHTEIKNLIQQNKGYHSGREVKNKECWSCHSEHHGRNFKIINFNPESFDHSKTTFELTGAHKKIDCGDCHREKFMNNSLPKKKSNTYLGLKSECTFCHEDFHQNTLGTGCEKCHTTDFFKPASKFNHNAAEFLLTGAHLNVDCVRCHPAEKRNGKSFRKFREIISSNCSSCHKDVHQGRFGNDCRKCHVTTSFKNIVEDSFDHNKTNFPLLGKHKFVNCIGCHKTSLSKISEFQNCIGCHSDYHKGEFAFNDSDKDCSECHTVNGFKPSTFSIEKHSQTKFPLAGSHLAVPCENCHYKNSEHHFRIKTDCISCHQNVHKNEISEKYMGGFDCSSCHNTILWSEVKFGHSKTGFPLEDKHLNVSCRGCHFKNEELKFASTDSECITCHNDIHFGQFEEAGVSKCERCHTFVNWLPYQFDHNKSRFPLEGAHLKLDCSRCHKQATSNGNIFIKYKIEKFKCADCHS